MANPEHVNILKQGVEVWNKWREENPDVVPDLSKADLKNYKLDGINFVKVDLNSAQLDKANLYQADFSDAFLSHTVFRGANLEEAHLLNARLPQAHMEGVSLINSVLMGANFRGANLSNANLRGAKFWITNLALATLQNADFSNAVMGYSNLSFLDLSSVMGLESIQFSGALSIGIETMYLSKGQIPDVFLRGAGIPETMITFMKSLTQEDVIQFYTCFISYTEADDLISERLYNDLQAAGVRCWRWREDAPWGKTLMKSVDEAIRVYDKLVVICSEKSLQAPAVIREIERALQKEDQLAEAGQEGEVLFPISLDDYIFEEWEHHRKADVVAKHVGDFTEWEDPKKYKDALDRLLRDLREE